MRISHQALLQKRHHILKKLRKPSVQVDFETGKMQLGYLESMTRPHPHKEAVVKWVHYTKSQSVAAQLHNRFMTIRQKRHTPFYHPIQAMAIYCTNSFDTAHH